MLHVHAEFLLPVLHVHGGAVHAQGTAADEAVFLSVQSVHHPGAFCEGDDPPQHLGIVEIPVSAEVGDTLLVQRAAGRQHGHHAGPIRIQLSSQKERTLAVFRRDGREVGPCEHAVGKDRPVHALRFQLLRLGPGRSHGVHQIVRHDHVHPAVLLQRRLDHVKLVLYHVLALLMDDGIAVGQPHDTQKWFPVCHKNTFLSF